jgi:two-component system cell cycle sensor histidine kinase/response regulator CckA
VLVVDDEPMIASLVKTLLESNGYHVAVAHHPEEAIAMARNATEPLELAVIDYGLPGMSGDKCLLELRNRWPDLKAILITGYEIDAGELNLPEVCILQKPFSSQSITQAVRAALDTPG